MKIFKLHIYTAIILFVMSYKLNAQMWHFNPDSLKEVTLTGKIIIDSLTSPMGMYYLDTDSNGTPEYMLNLGPSWYKPDSSSAQRPVNGAQVTIKGGEVESAMMNNYKMIVVYEINGAFWRDPFDPTWNNMGFYSHMGGHMSNGCSSFGFGFMHDTLKAVSLSGKVLTDTTFVNELSYLDVNNDKNPDYFLNLGPYWYQPLSGAKRPGNGDSVKITGGLLERSPMKMVLVYTINGQVWRDSTTIGKNLGGGWMLRNMTESVRIHSPFDTTTWMMVNPGWHTGGMMGGGMMMPDSLFGQILELLSGSIPNRGKENILAAYEVSFFSNKGINPMWQKGMCGSRMNFNNAVKMQLHFNDQQLKAGNFNKNTIKVKYWDNNTSTWTAINNTVLNSSNNTVSFSQNSAGSFLILTAETNITEVEELKGGLPERYFLDQNYPNPFNPTTVITYQIPKAGMVTLKVYDILGKVVAELVNQNQNAGSYSVKFGAENLSSGIYIYELRSGEFLQSRKMTVIK
ncbi:MAG: T9SS type A sorting domain-containing protein [Bacillota bacterium]